MGLGVPRHHRHADRSRHLARGARGLPLAWRWNTIFGLPLSFFGGALAHLGLGVTLLGLSGLGFGAETIATLHKGVPECRPLFDHPQFGRRTGRTELQGGDHVMTVRSGGEVVPQIEPARRQFAARGMGAAQAGLATLHFGQVYVSIAVRRPTAPCLPASTGSRWSH